MIAKLEEIDELEEENNIIRNKLNQKQHECDEIQDKLSQMIMGLQKDTVFKDELIQLREKIEQLEMIIRDFELENEAIRNDLSEKVLQLEKLDSN